MTPPGSSGTGHAERSATTAGQAQVNPAAGGRAGGCARKHLHPPPPRAGPTGAPKSTPTWGRRPAAPAELGEMVAKPAGRGRRPHEPPRRAPARHQSPAVFPGPRGGSCTVLDLYSPSLELVTAHSTSRGQDPWPGSTGLNANLARSDPLHRDCRSGTMVTSPSAKPERSVFPVGKCRKDELI